MGTNKKGLVCSLAWALVVVCALYGIPANAGITPSSSSLNFGSVSVNSLSSPSVITLTNNGSQSITILGASSNLPEFLLTGPSLPLTLASGQSASFQVVFRPDSATTFSGSLIFSLNRTSGGVKSISVTGTGTLSSSLLLSASANSLNFGNVTVGNSLRRRSRSPTRATAA